VISLPDLSEPVVTIACRMARHVPYGRRPSDHWYTVYMNFCDFFASWDEFQQKVRAYRGRIDR
jgi:hypothetical protein